MLLFLSLLIRENEDFFPRNILSSGRARCIWQGVAQVQGGERRNEKVDALRQHLYYSWARVSFFSSYSRSSKTRALSYQLLYLYEYYLYLCVRGCVHVKNIGRSERDRIRKWGGQEGEAQKMKPGKAHTFSLWGTSQLFPTFIRLQTHGARKGVETHDIYRILNSRANVPMTAIYHRCEPKEQTKIHHLINKKYQNSFIRFFFVGVSWILNICWRRKKLL